MRRSEAHSPKSNRFIHQAVVSPRSFELRPQCPMLCQPACGAGTTHASRSWDVERSWRLAPRSPSCDMSLDVLGLRARPDHRPSFTNAVCVGRGWLLPCVRRMVIGAVVASVVALSARLRFAPRYGPFVHRVTITSPYAWRGGHHVPFPWPKIGGTTAGTLLPDVRAAAAGRRSTPRALLLCGMPCTALALDPAQPQAHRGPAAVARREGGVPRMRRHVDQGL